MGQENRPTLRTIAELTGLAVTTVSRALADAPQIAPETRARVQRVAREIGYQPDRAAQRLRTGRSNVIALILPPHEEILGYGASMMRGIARALRGSVYHLVMMPRFEDVPEEEMLRGIIRNRLADGILFSKTRPDDFRVRFLLEAGMPFVSHGRTELASPHAWVDYDNFGFARGAVARLVAKGARRPCLVPARSGQTFAQHLRLGFLRGCAEAVCSGEVLETVDLDSPPEAIHAHLLALIAAGRAPDGYVCPGEVSAMAINAAYVDAGLQVPHIVMKSTSDLAGFIRPRFDSIVEDLNEAGQLMAELLLRQLAGEPVAKLHVLQPAPEPRSPGATAAGAVPLTPDSATDSSVV